MLVTQYTLVGDEVEEQDLLLFGEAEPDDDLDDSVPVRTLDEFCLFDRRTLEFVPSISALAEDSSGGLVGTGIVRTYVEGDDSEDEDEDTDDGATGGQQVLLSPIRECSVHWPVERKGFDACVVQPSCSSVTLIPGVGEFTFARHMHGIFCCSRSSPMPIIIAFSGSITTSRTPF